MCLSRIIKSVIAVNGHCFRVVSELQGLTGFQETSKREGERVRERERGAAAVSISLIRDFTLAAKMRGALNQENGVAAG